ncbi:MAG: 3-oxoacyl-[acyl-carrier-protein] synthase, partial [Variibacter sp.]|nr:3-oxoacyl-[acyl-carrier-protein] synthase [Variibacter sp.]
MTDAGRETWITGAGIVSGLGEGRDTHWDALDGGRIAPAAEAFAPYLVHPLAGVNFDTQIPKKGDQRQMEPWQRIGTYAAGLALDDAGIKGNADLLGRMDLVVAAGGGERDISVDSALLSALPGAADPAAFLNERLMNDLRPTLFLAQLSNLLAGNISIVHGVA